MYTQIDSNDARFRSDASGVGSKQAPSSDSAIPTLKLNDGNEMPMVSF